MTLRSLAEPPLPARARRRACASSSASSTTSARRRSASASLGRAAVADDGDAAGWLYGFLANRCLSIAGGTSEIQRNVIAERLLGLPSDLDEQGPDELGPPADARRRDPALLGCGEGGQAADQALSRLRAAPCYPRPFCPHCWSEDVEWEEASGAATLYTYSIVRRNDLPPFNERVPYVAAVVDLARDRGC